MFVSVAEMYYHLLSSSVPINSCFTVRGRYSKHRPKTEGTSQSQLGTLRELELENEVTPEFKKSSFVMVPVEEFLTMRDKLHYSKFQDMGPSYPRVSLVSSSRLWHGQCGMTDARAASRERMRLRSAQDCSDNKNPIKVLSSFICN